MVFQLWIMIGSLWADHDQLHLLLTFWLDLNLLDHMKMEVRLDPHRSHLVSFISHLPEGNLRLEQAIHSPFQVLGVCIKTWGTRWNWDQIICGLVEKLVWFELILWKTKGCSWAGLGWSEAYSGSAWLNKNRPIFGLSPTRTVKARYKPSLLETCYTWACPFSRLVLSMTSGFLSFNSSSPQILNRLSFRSGPNSYLKT